MNPMYYNNNSNQRPPLYGNPPSNNPPIGGGGIYGAPQSQPQQQQAPSIFNNRQFVTQVSNYLVNNNFPSNQSPYQQQPNSYNAPQGSSSSLISGKIGRIIIAQEDQETFIKSLKSVEWTQNPIYIQSRGIEVKPTFSTGQSNRPGGDRKIPKNCFDQYFLDVSVLDNYMNYKKEVEERQQKMKEDVKKEREDFIKYNFPNENSNMSLEDIYDKIAANKGGVLIRDNNLYKSVEKHIPFLKKTRDEDNGPKVFTNDGRGTPGATPPQPQPGLYGY